MTKDGSKAREKRPWRENIEALTMAVIVALLFKYFILEISKIPSGSMQPTLLGDPQTQVFDRVLVDKLSFHYRAPRRWEIVVFKHPLERSRIMVKRLVGLPGEELRIAGGDIWTRPDKSSEWRIPRRSAAVQEEMWRRLDPDEPQRSSWSVVFKGDGWRVNGRDVQAVGEGKIRFRASGGGVRDHYLDGYPEKPSFRVPPHILTPRPKHDVHPVGDLRVTGEIEALSGTESFAIELSEGSRTYEFSIPGPAGGLEAPRIAVRAPQSPSGEVRTTTASPYRLPDGRSVGFAAQNLDDRLSLEIDGEEVASFEIEPNHDQRTSITLIVRGAGAELEDLQVYRDIYYLPDPDPQKITARNEWTIPEDRYMMLGDNVGDSADSRDWKALQMYRRDDVLRSEPVTARCNYRGENENPWRIQGSGGGVQYRFLDEHGDLSWLPESDFVPGEPWNEPLVPLDLIQGRAVAVFWPIKPHRSLWRLTWLH